MAMTISGDNGLTFPAGSTQVQAGNYQSMVNRIINGRMEIDQRNAGASVNLTSAGQYTVDRWQAWEDTDGTMTAQQSSVAPTGFTNSLLFTTGTADASLSSGQFCATQQRIEGFNVADLGWGSANAQTVTLSFWVRSSLTGTFGGVVKNSAGSRSYPFTYTISAANTWEYKTVTIAGDTSGTWLTNNGIGINVGFGLGVSSSQSGTAGSWQSSDFISATGAVSVIGTAGATFYITGVDLRVGSYTVVPQDFRAYGTELALCQRYYEQTSGVIQGSLSSVNGQGNVQWYYKVTKRATPTVTGNNATTNVAVNTVDFAQGTTNNTGGYFATFSSGSTASAEL